MFFLEIVRVLDSNNLPINFTKDIFSIPKDSIVNLVDEIGSNLAGGLKLIGFFAYSIRLNFDLQERLMFALNKHSDLFKTNPEFSSPDLFLFANNGKTARVDLLLSDGTRAPIPIDRYKRPSECVTQVHLFLNKTFYLEEKEAIIEDSRDFSLGYNVW